MNNYQMFRKIQERDNIIKKYSNDTKEDLIDLVIEKDNIIENLQSKIDKAVETINYYASEDDDCGKIYNDEEKELLDIFKESKESNNTFEIPEFKGTMEQLDDLCNIRKE